MVLTPTTTLDEKGRWRYGDAGDRYPTEEGDIWAVGPHILACGDLEKGAARLLLERYPHVHMVMCDPPWDSGNARSFRTKAGVSRPVSFLTLMHSILEVGPLVEGAWFFEMGNRNAPLVAEAIRQLDGYFLNQWNTYYYKTKPCVIQAFTWNSALLPFDDLGPSGIDEEQSFTWALGVGCHVGNTVLDLCIGRGLTARVAHKQGKRVLGLELHPRRLAVTIDWLVTQGMTATKLDTPLY
jgi:hypothetical protein